MRLFISYQRHDDPNFAGRLRDRCIREVGDGNIFFDLDSILAGDNFVEEIQRMISLSDCMLVAIGPGWDPARLWREDDFVRMEVCEAHEQQKLVIPVLNGATQMPQASTMPEPMQFLARLNAATIDPGHFDRDAEVLLRQIRRKVGNGDDVAPEAGPTPRSIRDEAIRLGVPSRESRAVISGHEGHVLSLAFGGEAPLLASGGSDNTARLWDVDAGAERLRVSTKSGRVSAVALAGDAHELFASAGDVVHAWAVEGHRRRATFAGHAGSVWALALSPDSSVVATGAADNTACLWDAATAHRSLALRGHTGWVTAVAFSPTGECFATGSTDNVCGLWDPATGRRLLWLRRHTRTVTSVAFLSNRRWLASGSADGTCRIWDLGFGQEARCLSGHVDAVTSIAFVPDSEVVVTAGVDGSCRAWDGATGRPLRIYLGHEGRVHAVAVSPDGQLLASAGADGTIRLWDVDV